jgi:serine/threonine-protein kinase RsbW
VHIAAEVEMGDAVQTAQRIQLTIPPRPENVSLARLLAGALAERCGLSPEAVEDVRLLVSEACTNAVRAHLTRHETGPVLVDCSADGDFTIEISDAGGGFDGRGADDATVEGESGGDVAASGYGLPLMRRIAVRSAFERNPRGGTTVRLSLTDPTPKQRAAG